MVTAKGVIRKLEGHPGSPVVYALPLGDGTIPLNVLLGSAIRLRHTGAIFCIRCGRRTSRSFAQGYCFPCFEEAPECAPCIIRPDLCRAHEGVGRDMAWEQEHHLCEQVVYLAWTGGIKVGVTRAQQRLIRWIDQGASAAMVLALAPNRYLAGLLEVECGRHVSDRTNWRRMLSHQAPDVPQMLATRTKLRETMSPSLGEFLSSNTELTDLEYPVQHYPEKVVSVGFDKQSDVGGVLTGIKGQYLMFEGGQVINIRKYQGYGIEFEQ